MLAGVVPTGRLALTPIARGSNNRAFELHAGGSAWLLKAYFRHPSDPRDRLGAEFGFCSFAWDAGLRCVPRPIAADREAGLAVYEFVRGRHIGPADVGADAVKQAADFFRQINLRRFCPAARALPAASEACFSISEHLARVSGRVARLGAITAGSPAERDAAALVARRLTPAWERIRAATLASRSAGDPNSALPESARMISPSDFGFHNALLENDGRLRFLDFEYAGWDDPAKTVCDFFCQPDVPVPARFMDDFARLAVPPDQADPLFRARVELLMPVYRLKWCCIVLNEFVASDAARRRFARPGGDSEERKRGQILKAEAILAALGA